MPRGSVYYSTSRVLCIYELGGGDGGVGSASPIASALLRQLLRKPRGGAEADEMPSPATPATPHAPPPAVEEVVEGRDDPLRAARQSSRLAQDAVEEPTEEPSAPASPTPRAAAPLILDGARTPPAASFRAGQAARRGGGVENVADGSGVQGVGDEVLAEDITDLW